MAVPVELTFRVAADFLDIFEVRSIVTTARKKHTTCESSDNSLTFQYIDDVGLTLKTSFIFDDFLPVLANHGEDGAEFYIRLMLDPLEQRELNFRILPIQEKNVLRNVPANYEAAIAENHQWDKDWSADSTEFVTDNDDFNEMLLRSRRDVRMLITPTRNSQGEEGEYYIAAGIPWYVALFGRDSIITARNCLMLKPELARATLRILARYQGKVHDVWREEEPGKILHELRIGELARTGQIPHTPYYGSVDATPLWIILLYDYYLWTKDRALLHELWPHALAALGWIDSNTQNRLGYLSYQRQSEKGLRHQGWKDSFNSAMYEDGTQADPPLYLSEVQGYIYLAKNRMARLASIMEDREMSMRLQYECRSLKQRFNEDFWMADYKFPPLALDQDGKPLRVVSSNPGHCLETGILTEAHAKLTSRRLMEPDMFNGWGIRTLSSQCRAYNPMSYHNGSIWPHDNAIVARGFAILGQTQYVENVFTAMFEMGRHMHYKRLPELFCGFPREGDKMDPPVKYPVSCSPQAWAASAVFSLLQSSINLQPRWRDSVLWLYRPRLPAWLNYLQIKNLKVQGCHVDLELRRTHNTVMVDVLQRDPGLDILIEI